VTEHITGEYEICVDVGYFATKSADGDALEFIFPSKTNAFISAMVTSLDKYELFLEDVKEHNENMLMAAFEFHKTASQKFTKSGYSVKSAVVVNCYLTTF